MTDNFLRNIADATIDTKSPVSEDLMTRVRDNLNLLNSVVASISNGSLQGAADSITTGVIVDADPTAGAINHDDKFNGLYVHFTSGTLYTNNNLNRYKITDTDSAGNSITVAEDLAAAGGAAADTYIVIGHTHDGDATHPDGAAIDLKQTVNMTQDQTTGQDVADAITDPNSNRSGTADATTPFITGDDVANRLEHDLLTSATGNHLAGDTAGLTAIVADVGGGGAEIDYTASLTGLVPSGTKRVLCRFVASANTGITSNGISRFAVWNVDGSGTGFTDKQALTQYTWTAASDTLVNSGTWAPNGINDGSTNGFGVTNDWWIAVDNNLDVKISVYQNFGGNGDHHVYLVQWPVA